MAGAAPYNCKWLWTSQAAAAALCVRSMQTRITGTFSAGILPMTRPRRQRGPAVQSPLETYLREINETALLNADEEKTLAPWKELGVASAALLHTRDMDKAADAEFLKPLSEATGVWLEGSDPDTILITTIPFQLTPDLRHLV